MRTGSPVRAAGWIDIPEPYGFHLTGQATRLDLRSLPADVPVPHLRSSLTFEYDAIGRFRNPVLNGSATFNDSTFLDARIAAGAHGAVDTSGPLVTYSADGVASGLDLNQIGEGFDLETLRKAQYAGTVSGGFNLTGAGSSLDDLTVDVKGTGVTAALFGGDFSDMALDLQVRNDSLAGRGSGQFARIDSAIATQGAATGILNGRFELTGTMPGLFASGFQPDLSALDGTVSLSASRVNAVEIETGSVAGSFDTGLASITALDARTNMGLVSGKGRIGLSRGDSDFAYEAEIADASLLKEFSPIPVKGSATLKGRITGPLEQTRIEGTVTAANFDAGGITALTVAGKYTLEGPVKRVTEMTIAGDGSASFVTAFGQNFGSASATLAYDQERLQGKVEVRFPDSRIGRISGSMVVHADHNELHLSDLQIELGKQRWAMSAFAVAPIVSWSGSTITARGLVFDAGAGATGRITVTGDLGREAPAGEMSVTVTDVSLENLPPLVPVLAGYRGRLNGTVTIAGTLKDPGISATFRIAEGGVRKFSFQSLEGSGRWTGDGIVGDVRLDQRPGVWLTARGSVPMDLFSSRSSKKPVDIAVRSSTIDLGLIEGLTTAVRNVVGTLEVDVTVTGQADDPRFAGFLDVKTASFEVPATGSRYRNGTVHLAFVPEAVEVEQFRLEDSKGNPMELTGTVATRALRLGDLGFELSATQFEVLNNAWGELALNGVLTIRGTLPAPVVTGDLGIHRASLDADQIRAVDATSL